MDFESIKIWFFGLGEQYNVNPIIFGSIYVGAIPFFTLSIAWLIKNIKQKKSVVLPTLSASLFFVSAYLYLILVGRNVPIWVYIFVILMLLYGAWSTYGKVKKQLSEPSKPEKIE